MSGGRGGEGRGVRHVCTTDISTGGKHMHMYT